MAGPATTGIDDTVPALPTPRAIPRPMPVPAPRPTPAAAPRTTPAAAPAAVPPVDPDEAEAFLRLHHVEAARAAGDPEARIAAARREIDRTGTYVHTGAELAFGARVAWRNSARCIGRLYWHGLHVRDRRDVTEADAVAEECIAHLRASTRRGRVRSTITVLAPDTPDTAGPRIWNEQLVRYAGHREPGEPGAAGVPGEITVGDPRSVGFTDLARSLGWEPPSPPGRFDVLPLVVAGGGPHGRDRAPQLFPTPIDAVLEVVLTHPDHAWFADLGLRWHAVPAISDMALEVGGIRYPAAPFNGWYMSTEIGARTFADADRYDLLREVALGMGLDTSSDRSMWRDRAAVELTLAVQHSFDAAGVTVADHHGESARFLRHLEREEAAGRSCPVDWSWIVPPISGALTPVFHRYYDPPTGAGPRFAPDPHAAARRRGCPVAR